jgi:DNA-damage-inducible protein D
MGIALRDNIFNKLETCKKITTDGADYWMARDVQVILGYIRWDRFEEVIERSIKSCESAGMLSAHHFSATGNMVEVGSGAKRQRGDYYLSRYACYLICMNGDTAKPEIGFAQAYFAAQTRRQELEDKSENIQPRIDVRERIRHANKKLNRAAKQAGVQHYGTFHDAGYRGLYGGLRKAEIESLKKIPPNEDLLDCIGRTELAANEFRITQTEEKLTREAIQGETPAINTHFRVGKAVRKTIEDLGGTMPERLPTAPSIKKLSPSRKTKKKIEAVSPLLEGTDS